MNPENYTFINAALALAALLFGAPLSAQTAGEEWEYQGNMDMMGMKMPIPATKHCQPPTRDVTPPVNSNCKTEDVRTEGNTTSFRIVCGEPEPMEGSGTTTLTADQMESKYTLKTAQGEMTFNVTGKKLGACTL